MARQIEVVVAGRHAASGDFGAIRRLMTDRPNRFVLRTADDRLLASALLADPSVRGARLRSRGRHRGGGLRLRPVQRGAAAAGPRARRPAARGHADRRVAGERLRLPGVGMTHRCISPDDRPARRPQRLRPPPRGAAVRAAGGADRAGRAGARRSSARTPTAAERHALRPRARRDRARWSRCWRPPALLAPEIDDGSISYLLAKPISRHTIVVSKLVVAGGCVLVFGAAARCWSPGWCCSPATPRSRWASRSASLVGGTGVLRAVRAAVGADPARRGDRADLPAGLGGPARRPARRGPLAQHHPLGRRDRRPGRRPRRWSTTSALAYAVVASVVVIVARHLAHRRAGCARFNLTGDE